MKTYVVIPHYIISEQVLELAKNTIESFRKYDCIIVSVDDGSSLGSDEIKELSDVYIKNEQNSGFATTCNNGFKWVLENEKDDCYIVCSNNDIEVYGDWQEQSTKCFEQFGAAMVGGLGYREKELFGMPIENYDKNQSTRYSGAYVSDGGRIDDWLFPGGFYITKKSVLEKYGLYDEAYQHGGYEDIDLFLRIKNGGDKLIMTPKIWYWHKEGATRFSDKEKGRQSAAEPLNREYFKTKHGFDYQTNVNNIFIDNRINL